MYITLGYTMYNPLFSVNDIRVSGPIWGFVARTRLSTVCELLASHLSLYVYVVVTLCAGMVSEDLSRGRGCPASANCLLVIYHCMCTYVVTPCAGVVWGLVGRAWHSTVCEMLASHISQYVYLCGYSVSCHQDAACHRPIKSLYCCWQWYNHCIAWVIYDID